MKKGKKSLWDLAFGKEKKETFASVTSADGVELSYEGTLEVGTVVMTKNEEGEDIPATGEHQVSVDDKNWVITLDDQGVVTAMEEVEAGDDMSAQEFTAFMKKYDKEIKEFINTQVEEKLHEVKELALAHQKVIDLITDSKDDKFKQKVRKIAGEKTTFSALIRGSK